MAYDHLSNIVYLCWYVLIPHSTNYNYNRG